MTQPTCSDTKIPACVPLLVKCKDVLVFDADVPTITVRGKKIDFSSDNSSLRMTQHGVNQSAEPTSGWDAVGICERDILALCCVQPDIASAVRSGQHLRQQTDASVTIGPRSTVYGRSTHCRRRLPRNRSAGYSLFTQCAVRHLAISSGLFHTGTMTLTNGNSGTMPFAFEKSHNFRPHFFTSGSLACRSSGDSLPKRRLIGRFQ